MQNVMKCSPEGTCALLCVGLCVGNYFFSLAAIAQTAWSNLNEYSSIHYLLCKYLVKKITVNSRTRKEK